jgi:DNA-binding NarL/FixJ family response regulator
VSHVGTDRAKSPPLRVRVLAVDDSAAFRRAIQTLLRASHELEIVGEAATGERAIAAAQSCEPDLVLMDVRMPGIGRLAAAKAIKDEYPPIVVVLISTAHPTELPTEASTCGADAIVWKSQLRRGLLEAIWLRHRPPAIT